MKADIWCDLCNDKMKQVTVRIGTRELSICEHCESLCVDCVRVVNHAEN